jgi:hypothetical protein
MDSVLGSDRVAGEPELWTRTDAIANLREALLRLTDSDHSMCQIAAANGILCRGFRRWNASEFDRRWRGCLGRSTHLSRAQIEELANIWMLSEQIRQRVALSCDAQTVQHGACRGWDEFSNAELARFCADVLCRNVDIVA